MARNTKKNGSAKAADALVTREEMENRIQPLANDMTTMKWVVGFGFGLILIVLSVSFGVLVPITLNNLNKNDALSAELHSLQTEFEVYKAQNPN